ncbi:spermidine/putrescine ABC transporter substrate-binding protein [Salinisphaera sp. SPP-AMP-43]|uniref:ABC transporter substrate-binding protein n=1 Tax=Salinisphaera sp. SPP-AMP-43 TaxID=3121288 RepID=UPI003C6DBDD0
MNIVRRLLGLGLLAVLSAGPAVGAPAKKLYLYNWSQYMSPKILEAFEDQYDVEIVRNFYHSNPELFAKLRAGGDAQYDVIFPSNYYVPRLIATGLIQKLDKRAIPNFDNLMERFKKPPYDPTGEYVAAYQWGDTGIVYNTDKLGEQPASWSILFDAQNNAEYPFAVMTDAQVVLGAACAYQGHDYACQGRDNWKQAAKQVLETKQRPNFNGFRDGVPVLKQIARGTVDAAMTYNGDYISQKHDNPQAFKNTTFVVPKQGAELWVDSMAIPAHAPHPKLANQFINFVLDAQRGAELSNFNFYATPNQASKPYLDPILAKPPVTPTPQQMKTLQFTPSIQGDDLQFVQQLWTEIRSR